MPRNSSADDATASVETPFGPLTRDREAWHGSLPFHDRTLALRLRPSPGVALEALVDLIQQTLGHLDESVDRATRYAFHAEPKVPPTQLTLEGLEAAVPDHEWLRHHRLPSVPMLTLTFAIADDRNVLDIIFHGADPVALEYH